MIFFIADESSEIPEVNNAIWKQKVLFRIAECVEVIIIWRSLKIVIIIRRSEIRSDHYLAVQKRK